MVPPNRRSGLKADANFKMLRAERNKAVLINRNILAGFSVEEATRRAVKKPDFEHTVHPITAVHVMAIIRDRGIKAQVFFFSGDRRQKAPSKPIEETPI